MKTKTEKPALFVRFKSESGYGQGIELTIDASFCVTPEDGKIYPRGSRSPLDKLHFIIRGGESAERINDGRSAWLASVSIVFSDVYYADLDEVQAMAKALKSVHRKMDAIRERFGYASEPFELLARFADAIGADAFYFENDQETRIATGEKFRQRSRSDGLSQVRYEANNMAASLKRTEAA